MVWSAAPNAAGSPGTAMREREFVPIETDLMREARRDAVLELLQLPDPPDIAGRRRYQYRLGGDKLRQPEIKCELAACYVRHRMLDAGRTEEAIVSVRRGQ